MMEENSEETVIQETTEIEVPVDNSLDYVEEEDSKSEEELPPPEEENEAREVNVGNIIGFAVLGIIVVFLIAFIAINIGSKKKNKQEEPDLDKAGNKTVIEFKEKTSVDYYSDMMESFTENVPEVEKSEEEVEEAIEALPPQFQLPIQGEVGKAPVNPIGSTQPSGTTEYTYVIEKPDTRNSKSPRKIEGLASLDYSGYQSNASIVSQILSGDYGTNANGQKMTKEEYIAQQMAQTQTLQNQLYGTTGNYGSTAGVTSTGGNNKESFFNNGAGAAGSGQYLSKSALWDGTIISGALITAISTDNPGVVIARVTENVYSSYDHSYLLIPEGSLLMATYNSSISYAQKEVQVAWNLLIRPDNYRVQLGNMNGVNAQGASGYNGFVSNHPFETLKALGLVAIYSLIETEVTSQINSQNNEYIQNAMTDVYAQASNLGNKMVDKALDIKPTIKIKEGTEIKLITNTPLELPPVEIPSVTQKYVRTRK